MIQGSLISVVAAMLLVSLVEGQGTFSHPDGCTPGAVGCIYSFSWEVDSGDDTQLLITMGAASPGWVGMGFSKTGRMPDSDIMMGFIDNSGAASVTNRHALDFSTPIVDMPNVGAITAMTGTRSGSWMSVSFSRARQTGASSVFDFDLGTGTSNCPSYYLIFSSGTNEEDYHADPGSSNGPYYTLSEIDVCASGVTGASVATRKTTKTMAHGGLMLIAWLMLAPVGMFTARYLKLQLPNGRWFNIHRILLVIATVLTLISFAIIVNYDGHYSGPHTKLGLVIFILTMIQVLLGALRNVISGYDAASAKDENDHGPRRWIFNLLHWAIGRGLLPITLANLWLGLDVLIVRDNAFNLYYAAIAVIIVTFLVCELLFRLKSRSQASTIFVLAMALVLAALTAAIIGVANQDM